MPERIQLSRKKGWRMPLNTVKVDRTTKWGNPFVVGKHGTREQCVDLFHKMLAGYLCISRGPGIMEQEAYRAMVKRNRDELRGKNLACWCPPGAPCHADFLLTLRHRKRPLTSTK
jgi:hypothetical protein